MDSVVSTYIQTNRSARKIRVLLDASSFLSPEITYAKNKYSFSCFQYWLVLGRSFACLLAFVVYWNLFKILNTVVKQNRMELRLGTAITTYMK